MALKPSAALLEKIKYVSTTRDKVREKLKWSSAIGDVVSKYHSMMRVLRRLGHITVEGLVVKKGKVACCISSCDELLAAELIFSGSMTALSPSHVCALLSCLLVHRDTVTGIGKKEGKSTGLDISETGLSILSELQEPLNLLKISAQRVAQVVADAGLPIDIDQYVQSFQPTYAEVVYRWCNGATFAEVCDLVEVFEGDIIRILRTLADLLKQLAEAALSVGETRLETLFLQATALLKRDIVFSGSLYL